MTASQAWHSTGGAVVCTHRPASEHVDRPLHLSPSSQSEAGAFGTNVHLPVTSHAFVVHGLLSSQSATVVHVSRARISAKLVLALVVLMPPATSTRSFESDVAVCA